MFTSFFFFQCGEAISSFHNANAYLRPSASSLWVSTQKKMTEQFGAGLSVGLHKDCLCGKDTCFGQRHNVPVASCSNRKCVFFLTAVFFCVLIFNHTIGQRV